MSFTIEISTEGGIKAAANKPHGWVAEHWINFISGFMIGARFGRGKSYANKGQVLDINISPGLVSAKVQGSKRIPYEVKISFQTLPEEAWINIANALKEDSVLCAQVLCSGAFPQELERVFEREGSSLFPKPEDNSMSCSCPDWSIPCKHLVAVFILLGDAFENDPFLIFRLRGIERENFLAMLGISKEEEHEESEPLPYGQSFYSISGAIPSFGMNEAKNAWILDELGDFPLWKGKVSLKKRLEPIYKSAQENASNLLELWE